MRSTIITILTRLGSLRLTLLGMVALLIITLATYKSTVWSINWVALPLGLLSINLLSAIMLNRRFRQQGGLMLFHLGLLAIIVLAAFGTLTSFDARLEMTEGQAFNAADVEVIHQGTWHSNQLQQADFVQGKVEVDFVSAQRRGKTQSQIILPGRGSEPIDMIIGDKVTFEKEGYRFLTTGNKGYSIILTWIDDNGGMSTGAINMPSYPFFEWKQENEWVAPDGERVLLKLELPDNQRPDPMAAWTLTSDQVNASLIVHTSDGRHVLQQGDNLALKKGSIRFDDIRIWMGYRIDYNAMLIWQFLAASIAIIGLSYHFKKRFFNTRNRFPIAFKNKMDDSLHV